MKKLIIVAFAAMVASGATAALIVYDSFSDEIVATNGIPAGWNADEGASAHSRIISGSLSYAGLQASLGNSWGLGQGTEDYSRSVSGITGLVAGDKVYYSFLMRLNSPLDAFSTGYFRLYNTASPSGSGLVVGWGTSDYTSNLMGFSLHNRNRDWAHADSIKTPQTYTAADTTYLIVVGYNREATYQASTVQLWINPDSSSFGTATPPTATITMPSYQNGTGYNNEATWNIIDWTSNGSSAGVPNWQVDEFRIATDWASVVPAIPEPATIGMIGVGALITLLIRRFRG